MTAKTIQQFAMEQLREKTGDMTIDGSNRLRDTGLSSLDAVVMCGDIEDHFNVEIDPVIVFEIETVKELLDKLIALETEG